jgi:4-amino-4-deoxychorismate lyase
MSLLIETIKCKNGELVNLRFHQARLNLSRKALFRSKQEISLLKAVQVPEQIQHGLYRCRVLYGEVIEKIEFIPHTIRPVRSLKLVMDNHIDYRYKLTDRKHIEQLFEQRANCDDVLIVKNGFITDSSIANTVFWDGSRWWTSDTPLLPGTQRARLIVEKKIFVCNITPSDLHKYQKAGLINAMQDLEEMPEIPVGNIF